VFPVTNSKPLVRAIAAIIGSATPMGYPTRSKSPAIRPASSAAGRSNGRISSVVSDATKACKRRVLWFCWNPRTISMTLTVEVV
jgi:hypothetical protein